MEPLYISARFSDACVLYAELTPEWTPLRHVAFVADEMYSSRWGFVPLNLELIAAHLPVGVRVADIEPKAISETEFLAAWEAVAPNLSVWTAQTTLYSVGREFTATLESEAVRTQTLVLRSNDGLPCLAEPALYTQALGSDLPLLHQRVHCRVLGHDHNAQALNVECLGWAE